MRENTLADAVFPVKAAPCIKPVIVPNSGILRACVKITECNNHLRSSNVTFCLAFLIKFSYSMFGGISGHAV